VNLRKTSVEDYLKLLEAAGMAARRVGPAALRLQQAVNVAQIPGFETAWPRCRMPAPSWPRRCSTCRTACACWTPAPPRAARAAISSNARMSS
jgi:hypothetical protein